MCELTDRDLRFHVRGSVVAATLKFLQGQGARAEEGVVLWPGRLRSGVCEITTLIVPAQITGARFYRIPDDEVFRILKCIAAQGLAIPIQVHSHEDEAFHSSSDDEYAFVQHENGVSVVVPDFGCLSTTQFADRSHFYRLVGSMEWERLHKEEISRRFIFEDHK